MLQYCIATMLQFCNVTALILKQPVRYYNVFLLITNSIAVVNTGHQKIVKTPTTTQHNLNTAVGLDTKMAVHTTPPPPQKLNVRL